MKQTPALYVNVIPLLQIGQPFDIGAGKFSLVSSDALMPVIKVCKYMYQERITKYHQKFMTMSIKSVNECYYFVDKMF